ncbi:hypothetical protein HKBW3S43_01453, partial [Candidatus Hakubella thermalkaliphila]
MTFKLIDQAPESKTIVLLKLYFERVFNYLDAPFLFELWPFPQHFLLELFRHIVIIHFLTITVNLIIPVFAYSFH